MRIHHDVAPNVRSQTDIGRQVSIGGVLEKFDCNRVRALLRGLVCAVALLIGAPQTAATAAEQAYPLPIIIEYQPEHSAIELAASELVKYLELMAGSTPAAKAVVAPFNGKSDIRLGVFEDFGVTVEGVSEPLRDDAVYVRVDNTKGIIAGSNPRSVLFAVYRFLEAAGCRWIRPGPGGDYVPSRPIDDLSVQIKDKATNSLRGHNNTGTYGLDYILHKIEWAPKVGLNVFFNEWFVPRMNFDRWYSRRYPSSREPAPRSDAEMHAFTRAMNIEAKRRGLILHAVGHGWNARFLGISEAQSDHDGRLVVPEHKRQYLAMVDGERGFHTTVDGERVPLRPTFVDLCYGQAAVREGLVQLVVDYATNHPEVDLVQFWLDDRRNDTCECELCRNAPVSDFYVMMLNNIDEELSRRNLATQIGFLVYQDTNWAPMHERLENPERFLLQFSPISRAYDRPYEIPAGDIALPVYETNQNAGIADIGTLIGLLREWQRVAPSNGFAYDYHMVWFHFFDPGYYGMLDVLAGDIRKLPELNLQGFVSCQNQKSFFPHGLPHHAHARLLWKPETPIEEIAQSYFEGAFGAEGEFVALYMKTLSDLFTPSYFYRMFRTSLPAPDDGDEAVVMAKLEQVKGEVVAFKPVIERNLSSADPLHRRSWEYLRIHSGWVLLQMDVWQARAEGRREEERAGFEAMARYYVEHEKLMETVFDAHWFQRTFPSFR